MPCPPMIRKNVRGEVGDVKRTKRPVGGLEPMMELLFLCVCVYEQDLDRTEGQAKSTLLK